MGNKKVVSAILIVIAIILIAIGAWYFMNRYHTVLVPSTSDGGTVSLQCAAGQSVKVVSASYTPSGAKAVDVTANLQTILKALSGASYVVSGVALGQPAGGALTFRYKCQGAATKSGFRPVPISTCGAPYDDHYAIDMTGRNAAGTVVWDPYSTQSRISLERYAETPESAEELNPVTGLGKTSSVRKMSDRYRRSQALQSLSMFELQPGQPGFMVEVGDSDMSLMPKVARRSPMAAVGSVPCPLATADVDSDFLTDGFYDEAALKEMLTSRRRALPNTLTASKTGLGSIYQDPRFEPGPRSRTPDGDASWSHGGHAGGPTSGGFGAFRFLPGNTWDSTYVRAFGDGAILGRQFPVEVMNTEQSQW